MRREAYLTDCWKTALRVSGSFCALIFENAGNRIVDTGVTKNAIRTAKLQGYSDDQLKKLEDVLARAKDVDEAITEFRRLKDDAKAASNGNGHGKHIIAKGESELVQKLDDGWSMVQTLNEDRFLLQRD